MAFFKLIVAVALLVTSLNATRLDPMTLSWRRRHDYAYDQQTFIHSRGKLTMQSPPLCVNVPSKYVTLCQLICLNPRWHSSRLWGSCSGAIPGKGGSRNICNTISPTWTGEVLFPASTFCPINGNAVSNILVSQRAAISLKQMNARARVPSGFR